MIQTNTGHSSPNHFHSLDRSSTLQLCQIISCFTNPPFSGIYLSFLNCYHPAAIYVCILLCIYVCMYYYYLPNFFSNHFLSDFTIKCEFHKYSDLSYSSWYSIANTLNPYRCNKHLNYVII